MPEILLDTCVILYTLAAKPLAPAAVSAMMNARANGAMGLSVVTAWELGMLSSPTRKRPLALLPTPRDFVHDAFSDPAIVTVELTRDIAFDASHLPNLDHKDPADRLLIATARALDVPLVTDDRKILDYAHRGYMKAIAC